MYKLAVYRCLGFITADTLPFLKPYNNPLRYHNPFNFFAVLQMNLNFTFETYAYLIAIQDGKQCFLHFSLTCTLPISNCACARVCILIKL